MSSYSNNQFFKAMDESKENESKRRVDGWNGAPACKLGNNYEELVLAVYGKATRGTRLDLSPFDRVPTRHLGLLVVAMFQVRDVLNGKGERDLFHQMFDYVVQRCPETGKMLLCLVPEHGYWKDLVKMYTRHEGQGGVFQELQTHVVQLFLSKLVKEFETASNYLRGKERGAKLGKMSLAWKWAPRLKSKHHKLATVLAKLLPPYLVSRLGGRGEARFERAYRKLLRTCSDACPTVEHLLCGVGDGRVSEEQVMERFKNCGWVPSVALTRLRKALQGVKKNGEKREGLSDLRQLVADLFNAHVDRVKTGEAKVNAKACQPTDLMKFFAECKYDAVMEEQFNALLKTLAKGSDDDQKGAFSVDLGQAVALPDVSHSMTCSAGSSGLTCMEVAMFLGMVVAKLATVHWRDRVLTFETNPHWVQIDDCKSYCDAFRKLKNAPWGGSTDFEKALDRVLDRGVSLRLSKQYMPKVFVVLSDMQFNQASNQANRWETVHESMVRKWAAHGYTLPLMVYWNLNGNTPGFAVDANTPNTVMVSGFSPALLKLFMSGGDLMSFQNPTPMDLMMTDLMSKHYRDVRQVVRASPELDTPCYFPDDQEQDPELVEPYYENDHVGSEYSEESELVGPGQ
jgi:hypothetical protein